MAKKAVKVQDLQSYKDDQEKKEKANKKRRKAVRTLKKDLAGKTFADLTAEEKDDLLKAFAISSGILKE